MAGLAGPDGQPDREVGLAGARRAQEHDVGALGDEIQGPEVRNRVALEGPLEGEVEVLEGLAGREPRRLDAPLAAVVLAGGDLTLQAGGEELLVGPGLGSCPFGEPVDRSRQRRCLERAAQIGEITGGLGGGLGHHATPSAWS